jgi:hypothetical protein
MGSQSVAMSTPAHGRPSRPKIRDLERQRDARALSAKGRTTLAVWMAEWIALRDAPRGRSPLTVKGYRTGERHVAGTSGRPG